jgi:large subunit ribosomal protein L3
LDSSDSVIREIGGTLELNLFSVGQRVDVAGKSIGKGFAGGVKRHHFSMQDATHGNSLSHRVLGSIGMCQTPGRVFKGKKMAGHLGSVKRTVQNLTIYAIDLERNLILVKGAVPGAKGGDLIITPAIKQKKQRLSYGFANSSFKYKRFKCC